MKIKGIANKRSNFTKTSTAYEAGQSSHVSNQQQAFPSKTADVSRRVIFPSLHKSTSTPNVEDINKNSPRKTPLALRRTGSFDSPRTVLIADLNTQQLPAIPSFEVLGESREKLKVDPSRLIIPPFKRSANPPPLLLSTKSQSFRKEKCGALNRKLVSSNIRPRKKNIPLESILRKEQSRSDLAPVGVPLSQSENSLLDGRVCFDPYVWVHEFKRDKDEFENTWFSIDEMEQFKKRAIELVSNAVQLVPTGTGRLVQKHPSRTKAIFTNPALLADDDEESITKLAETHIRRILVIDPHDLCAKLFGKSLRKILPHADIEISQSRDEAIRRIEKCRTGNTFDLILVEERLKMVQDRNNENVSGSALIKMLKKKYDQSVRKTDLTLFIGVSAHFEQDKAKLFKGGATLVWQKPPPTLDMEMRDKILEELLIIRGKQNVLNHFQ